MDDLWWREEDADYIRHRGDRYPGATSIEPEWTHEAALDPRRIVCDPDPKSRTGASRIIGFSPSAGFVITVIVTPDLSRRRDGVEEQRGRPPPLRKAGHPMTDDAKIDAEIQAVRDEYADEEAEAAEIEAAEKPAALDVPLSLRITRDLDSELRRRAAAEQIPTSALVRRLLNQSVQGPSAPVLTVEQVEAIARRVAHEPVSGR